MLRRFKTAFSVATAVGIALVALTPLDAQVQSVITEPVNNSVLVTLAGNTYPEATVSNDRGVVPESTPMKDVWLLLKRPPAVQKAWLQFLDDQQNPKSPNYHKWLTTKEAGDRFGAAPQDIQTVKQWLEASGFTVEQVATHGTLIDFSGTVAQINQAFHTAIHYYQVNGEMHYANASDPQIPAALAPVVAGPVSLGNFMPHPMLVKKTAPVKPSYDAGGISYTLGPGDLATVYNFNPAFNAGYTGAGVTIVALGVTDLYTPGDFGIFRKEFGLARPYPNASLTTIHPPIGNGGVCIDPGYSSGDAFESILDTQYSSSAAPNANIVLASCASTQNFGGFIALDNLLTFGPIPQIVSISYGIGEDQRPSTFNQYINNLYQVATGDGVSVFVASGDYGAATDDGINKNGVDFLGITVSGFASTPYDVAVGGTDFGDLANHISPSAYWSGTNGTYFNSALSYIQEIPWNNSCGSLLIAQYQGYPQTFGSAGFCNSGSFLNLAADGGGPSAIYPKPGFQSAVIGNPNDGKRDLPDISLFAASGVWGHSYILCFADTTGGGHPCTGPPNTWNSVGGTSASAPLMAGIMALVVQKYEGTAGNPAGYLGNPLPRMYQMAGTTYGGASLAQCNSSSGASIGSSCIFYDVTQGDNDVPCAGSVNCYLPSGRYGVLSTDNNSYQPAYGATSGWDFATGIGSVNAFNFVQFY